MKKRYLAVVCAAGLSAGVGHAADNKQVPKPAVAAKPAPRIELKGLAIGMSEEEVAQASRERGEFTIGGAKSKYSHSDVTLEYREGKLDTLYFFFDPDGFSSVLDAVRGRYPALRCTQSKVANRMGAEFAQVECELRQAGAHLTLRRFVGDISTSALSLVSDAFLQEKAEASRKKAKDI